MTEYIKFSETESIYGNKNLLHSELEILKIIKTIRKFKKLRNETIVLKITLKKKIDKLKEILKILDKSLPKAKIHSLIKPKDKAKENIKEEKENLTLEQEIEIIRRKLEKLQRN